MLNAIIQIISIFCLHIYEILLFITILFILLPLLLSAQDGEESRFGLSLHGGLFSEFTIHEHLFTESAVLDLRAHLFDDNYTRMEYSLNYSRGYHPSVSYSFGLSAGYRFRLMDSFF